MAYNYYSLITFLICLMMIVMIIHLSENETLSKRKKNGLRYIAEAILLGTFCEFLGFYLNGSSIFTKNIHGLVKVIEFSISPVISYLFYILLRNNEEKRHGGIILNFIIVINFLIQIASLFYPLVFYIDKNNYYQRGNYYYLYIVSYFIGIMICTVELFFYSKRHQSNGIRSIVAIVLFLLCGFGSRFVYTELHTDWLVIAIIYMAFFICYSDLYLRVDSLTGLLNRRAYDNRIGNIDFDTAIIIFDVDDFKSINDTKGHSYGDKVLKLISKSILKTYLKYGYCYRIGGDEFCVILREGVLQKFENGKKRKNNNVLDLLDKEFNKLIEDAKAKDKELDSALKGVSKGFDIFRYNDEHDVDIYYCNSIKETIENADSKMYQEKSEKKE